MESQEKFSTKSELIKLRDRVHDMRNDIVGLQLNLKQDINEINTNVRVLTENLMSQKEKLSDHESQLNKFQERLFNLESLNIAKKAEKKTWMIIIKNWPSIILLVLTLVSLGVDENLYRLLKKGE